MPDPSHQIVFCGCARDCAAYLPAVLANIQALAARFPGSACLFVENDSADDTAALLGAFCQQQGPANQLLALEGLAQQIPQRTVRLAMARNALIAGLRQWYADGRYTLMVMLDLDDVNTRPWDLDAIEARIAWMHQQQDVVAVFPNQLDHYYDLWALREPERCPGDAWEEVFDHAMRHGCSDQEAFDQTFRQRIFTLPVDAPPMEVDSAFGGLGIYRMQAVLNNPAAYSGEAVKVWGSMDQPQVARWQRCEHVSFHLGLRQQGGRLLVLPDLINADASGAAYPADGFRGLSF